MTRVRLLVDDRARLGECAVWCERSGALYWTDIEGSTVSRRQADGHVQRWHLPERVGSFALCEGESRLLLGLASGVALFDLRHGTLSATIPVESDQPTTRINDGRCDRQGRFVFGMFNPAEQPVGHFYRVGADLQVERLPLPAVAVANSIAFSPDGATMYYTDSPTRAIWQVPYHADGRLGAPRLFTRVSNAGGFPDGSCVDAGGGLWNAQWDGGCVVRYDASGTETARIALPVSRPTCRAGCSSPSPSAASALAASAADPSTTCSRRSGTVRRR
jgi:L-arabinonolactonase